MTKLSSLPENKEYTIAEIAAHITAVKAEDDSHRGRGLCPALREAAFNAQYVSQKDFVAACISIGINKNTAAIQFRNARKEEAEMNAEDLKQSV